eukprot:364531-Chlamydomonas_euryale.AAC.8
MRSRTRSSMWLDQAPAALYRSVATLHRWEPLSPADQEAWILCQDSMHIGTCGPACFMRACLGAPAYAWQLGRASPPCSPMNPSTVSPGADACSAADAATARRRDVPLERAFVAKRVTEASAADALSSVGANLALSRPTPPTPAPPRALAATITAHRGADTGAA